MFVKVRIENSSKFQLDGINLITELPLSPWEAVLGTRCETEYIDGNAVLYIPAGIQNGETIKIPKKGYINEKGERGYLFIHIKIVTPKKPTDDEIALFEKLYEISAFNPRKNV